jgi:O-antigen/teichoic acid export membrane protein
VTENLASQKLPARGHPRIAVSILYYTSGHAATAAFGVVTAAVLARFMSKAAFGEYTYLLALAMLFLPITDMGATALYSKKAARDRKRLGEYWARATAIKMYGIPAAAFALSVYFLTVEGGIGLAYVLVLTYMLLQSVMLGTDLVFRAGELARAWAIRRIMYEVSYLLLTVLSLVALGLTGALQQYVIAVVALGVAGSWAIVTAIRTTGLSWKDCGAALAAPLRGQEISELWPFALNAALYVFYYRLTAVFLQKLATPNELADFRVGFVVMSAALSLPMAVSWASGPRIAMHDENQSTAAFSRVVRRSADLNLFLAGFMTLGGLLYGARLIAIVFGPKYADLQSLWLPLNLAMGLFFLQQFSVELLNQMKRERHVARTFAMGIGVLTVLNLVLIPTMGAVGAAWARFASGCVMVPFNLYALAQVVGKDNLFGMNKVHFATLHLIAAAVGLLLLKVSFWGSLFCYVVTYGVVVFVLGMFPIRQVKENG